MAKTEKTLDIGLSNVAPVYADRITNVSFGPVVSKLFFSKEVSKNKFEVKHEVVLPTTSLIDALNFMQETLHNNKELTQSMIDNLDLIKFQIENL